MATATIDWKPFSQKHKHYIKQALRSKMSVAEGSVRSGKTIDNCIIACIYLEKCSDKIHLASGSTIANAKMNIGDCNGFGLEHLFRGRCRWGKYKDNEALYLNTQGIYHRQSVYSIHCNTLHFPWHLLWHQKEPGLSHPTFQ